MMIVVVLVACRGLLYIICDVRMVAKHPGVHQRYTLVVFLTRIVCRGGFDVVVDVFVVKHLSCDFDIVVGYYEFQKYQYVEDLLSVYEFGKGKRKWFEVLRGRGFEFYTHQIRQSPHHQYLKSQPPPKPANATRGSYS